MLIAKQPMTESTPASLNAPSIAFGPDPATSQNGDIAFESDFAIGVIKPLTFTNPLASAGTPTTLAFTLGGVAHTPANVSGFDPNSPVEQAVNVTFGTTRSDIGKTAVASITNADGSATTAAVYKTVRRDLVRLSAGHPFPVSPAAMGWSVSPAQTFAVDAASPTGGGIVIPTTGITFTSDTSLSADPAFLAQLQVILPSGFSHITYNMTINGIQSDNNTIDGPLAAAGEVFNVPFFDDNLNAGEVVIITLTSSIDPGFPGSESDHLPLLTMTRMSRPLLPGV